MMGKFMEKVDSVEGHMVAKYLLYEWRLEFARDYSEKGDEATKRWFG